MADLLAIISLDRRRKVEPVAIERLVADHAALRGACSAREDAGDERCRVAVLSQIAEPVIGTEHEDRRWAAWAGSRTPGSAFASLADLGGQFAIVRREPDEEIVVASDALGMKPFFLATVDGLLHASTSALVLARFLGLRPSRAGVEAFLRTGNQFGRLTAWEGLQRLLPAEACRVGRDGGTRRETYWRPTIDPDLRGLGFAEATSVCIEGGRAAGADLVRDHCWVDLTGGFDSRLLALLAARGEHAFETNTIGPAESEDVRIAARVAATAGWPWKRFDLPDAWGEQLTRVVDSAVAWSDCRLDALALAEVAEGHRRKRPTSELLLNGGGGEHLRDYPWAHELWRAGRSDRVSFHRLVAWRVIGPLDLTLFRHDPTPSVGADLRGELEARVAPFAGMPNTFQGDLLYAFKSTGHFGAYQASAAADLRVELPFYERGLFDTAISIAPRHRARHRLMRSMIHRLDPLVAALPTETGGPAEPVRAANLARFAPYAWRRSTKFGARLRGRVRRMEAQPAAASASIAGRAILVGRLRAEGRLDPRRMRSATLFDRTRLDETLRLATSEPLAVDWAALGRIVTLELSLVAADAAIDA